MPKFNWVESMAKFSRRSEMKLESCHEDLQRLFEEVIKTYDCTILEGYRPIEMQLKYFNTGKSKVKSGKHNVRPSRAVDVAPYPIDWNDKNRFYHFCGFVMAKADSLGIKIRGGHDWDNDKSFSDQTFHDLPHFELIDED